VRLGRLDRLVRSGSKDRSGQGARVGVEADIVRSDDEHVARMKYLDGRRPAVDGQTNAAAHVAGQDALVGPGDETLHARHRLVANDEIGAEIGADDEQRVGAVNASDGRRAGEREARRPGADDRFGYDVFNPKSEVPDRQLVPVTQPLAADRAAVDQRAALGPQITGEALPPRKNQRGMNRRHAVRAQDQIAVPRAADDDQGPAKCAHRLASVAIERHERNRMPPRRRLWHN
jgi:hypothetical protein